MQTCHGPDGICVARHATSNADELTPLNAGGPSERDDGAWGALTTLDEQAVSVRD
jgi:hypothetical protein